MEPLGAPADERVAQRRPQTRHAFLARGLPWLLVLAVVLVLQHRPVHWDITDGRLRAALHLLVLGLGFVAGWSAFDRDLSTWSSWPPEGVLFERAGRRSVPWLAAGWWQFLWVIPVCAVSISIVLVIALLAVVRPGELAGTLHAADLVWRGVVAAGIGGGLSQALGISNAEAITARGVHTSPVSFAPWRQLSHAIADPAAGVVRVYSRRRPWLPLSVMALGSREEYDRVRELVGEHLLCLSPHEEPGIRRLEWLLFAGGMVLATGVVTAAVLLLLLLPAELQVLSAGMPMQWLILALEQVPELTLLIAFYLGRALDTWLMGMRGIKLKRIVSEAS